MADPDLIRRVYEEYDAHQFAGGSEERSRGDDPRISQILRLVGSGKRVLDVGVSHGEFALALKRHGNHVVGLDVSERAVALCRSRGLEARRVNVETEPLPELGEIDVVLMLEVVEHLIDPLPVLRRLRQVLAPTGCLILSTPNAAYVKWRLALLRGRLPDFGENRRVAREPRPYNLLHKTPLTIPVLRDLLTLSGFRMVWLEPEDYGMSRSFDRPVVRSLRDWLRRIWPSLFAGSVVVRAVPGE